jgi:hypothetical protein
MKEVLNYKQHFLNTLDELKNEIKRLKEDRDRYRDTLSIVRDHSNDEIAIRQIIDEALKG